MDFGSDCLVNHPNSWLAIRFDGTVILSKPTECQENVGATMNKSVLLGKLHILPPANMAPPFKIDLPVSHRCDVGRLNSGQRPVRRTWAVPLAESPPEAPGGNGTPPRSWTEKPSCNQRPRLKNWNLSWGLFHGRNPPNKKGLLRMDGTEGLVAYGRVKRTSPLLVAFGEESGLIVDPANALMTLC